MRSSVSQKLKYFWGVVLLVLLCVLIAWRAFGLEGPNHALRRLNDAGLGIFLLSVMLYCAFGIRSAWRDYEKTGDTGYISVMIQASVIFIGMAVVLILHLYEWFYK